MFFLVVSLVAVSVMTVILIVRNRRLQENLHQKEKALLEANERFQLVSYTTSDVIWEWDLLTNQVWRNQGIQLLFGHRGEQPRTDMEWWKEHLHPDDREKVFNSMQTAIKRGDEFWSKEYRFQRADGTYAYVFDRSYIIHNGYGEPVKMLGSIMDISTRIHSEKVLRQEAVIDPLTGLFNRRYLEEALDQEIRRAVLNDQTVGILMLDIDNFKQVNDMQGHAIGDRLLRDVAAFLLKNVRGTDIVCRYGGDEFILILPTASMEFSRQRGETLRQGISELDFSTYCNLNRPLTLSIGVAVFPEHGDNLQAAFEAADSALYGAKQSGRNRVCVAGNNHG
ncbi:MAG: sensor domain-containing diguanylate cyclase [Anaerolineales bacterium]|nr:sensor domain-containing diguanylate cyclase [Anaerolineales bacterium]